MPPAPQRRDRLLLLPYIGNSVTKIQKYLIQHLALYITKRLHRRGTGPQMISWSHKSARPTSNPAEPHKQRSGEEQTPSPPYYNLILCEHLTGSGHVCEDYWAYPLHPLNECHFLYMLNAILWIYLLTNLSTELFRHIHTCPFRKHKLLLLQ